MANKFQRYRIWPDHATEEGGVYAYGRSAREAAEEAFLDFVRLDDPPARIELHCRHEFGERETVIVEPAFSRPFIVIEPQPELSF